jgi:hypothetical protein
MVGLQEYRYGGTDSIQRERLRRQGLRPIQIWVPDVRSRAFAAAAHQQSLAVAHGAHAAEDQEFIDAVSDWDPA